MSKQPKILISHILDSIELIETYVRQISAEEFMASPQVQDAVIRRLEIIGEAAKNLRRDFWEMYPDLPWREIAGFGSFSKRTFRRAEGEQEGARACPGKRRERAWGRIPRDPLTAEQSSFTKRSKRDVLIHEYFAVDLKLTWNVIQRNLPTLRRRLKEILPNLQ